MKTTMNINWARAIVCISLCCWFGLNTVNARQVNHPVSGFVTASNGDPIEGVLVIASGAGFAGWATTGKDGSFGPSVAGKFVSFRHTRYKPVLVRASSTGDPMRVRLEPADEAFSRLEPCGSKPNNGKGWVGSGLRVRPPTKPKGPIFGEHDSHWYVRKGKDRLHIVDGYAWHSGLPLEDVLVRSQNITVRGWTFGENVVLDLSGQTTGGKYWRWVGLPVAEAIEYETAQRATADYFDKIIETMCW
jgi:hypothetical protein